jgi:hypothetical protein
MAFHQRKERWACIVAHRRAGKTVCCINDLIKSVLTCTKPNPRLGYIAPYYAQAKDVAWTYLKEFSAPLPGVEINESELRVDFHNGGRIRLYGADNYNRMRGIYLDDAVLDEPADMDPRAWPEVIRPALADRQGRATFIGTPKGRNGFFEVWDNASRDPAWFRTMMPEQYAQEFECSYDAAIMGAYYGSDMADLERAGRITELVVDPVLPVHTAWDLGHDDPTAIWFFQVAPDGIRVVDYYESAGKDIEHYAGELLARGYRYGTHWLPHDAKAKFLSAKRTTIEQLHALLPKHELRIVPDHKILDGINAGRLTLKRTWFDADKCKFGIEALRQYRSDYDEKAKVLKPHPKHDWTSHCADAFRYLAMAWKQPRSAVTAGPAAMRGVGQITVDEFTRSVQPKRDAWR